MASVLVPVLYLLVVFGGLFVFGRYYMGRHASKGVDSYFPRHVERDVYVTLIAMDPPAPDALLKSALVRRAMTDVHRILRIREDKPAIQQLLQKGLVGEDLWTSILAAEKELETEILEVQAEANTFVEGWGTIIFTTAGEMVNHEKIHAVFKGLPKMKAELEAKYGRKMKGIGAVPPGVVRASTPAPSAAKSPVSTSSASTTPAPVTPKSPSSTLPVPSSAESTFSGSDGEGLQSASSPSKAASKKSKKRK